MVKVFVHWRKINAYLQTISREQVAVLIVKVGAFISQSGSQLYHVTKIGFMGGKTTYFASYPQTKVFLWITTHKR